MSKREITEEEIEELIDFIEINKMIPYESAKTIADMNKDRFRKQLNGKLIYPDILAELKESLKKNYFKSIVHPGESVGILCAQSIGERQVHGFFFCFLTYITT
jgi:hypothetical protein